MSRKKTTKVYETIFVVEGNGDFPLDMLRYDSAFPMVERDAHIAAASGRRRVALISRRVNSNDPTDSRWRSFGWAVVGFFSESATAETFRDQLAPPRGQAGV